MMYQWRWFRTAGRGPRECGDIRAATMARAAVRATSRLASRGALCLGIITTTVGFATEGKEAVPQGYGDAATAKETPAAQAAASGGKAAEPAQKVPQGYGNAPTATEPAAATAAEPAKEEKPADPQQEAPSGYADAPAAENPAVTKAAPAAKAAAEGEEEVPAGYEEAATADKPPAGAKRAIAAEAADGRVDLEVLGLEKQYLPRFREQVLKPELAFVRRVCQPDDDQLREVAVAAQERLAGVVRKYATAQNGLRHGGMGHSSNGTQPRELVLQDVAAVVKEKLRPDQVERYRQECELRAASRKRAVVLNVVARLDDELLLSAEQRDKLVALITENYQESWGPRLRLLASHTNPIPEIPHKLVDPVLNERQKIRWREILPSGHVSFVDIDFAPAGPIIEDPEWEDMHRGP